MIKKSCGLFTLLLISIICVPALAKDGDRLSPDQSIQLLGSQGPMPGEYVLVNSKTRMCLGKTTDKETKREVLLTLKCNEAAVKTKNYQEFLAIIPNTKKFFNLRNAKMPDAQIEKGKYGQCATFNENKPDQTALNWADCDGIKSDKSYKSNARPNQSFDFIYLSNKTWMLQYMGSNGESYCLDLLHQDFGNSEVTMMPCNYEPSQQWAVVYAGDLKDGPTKSSVLADGYVKDSNGVLVRARIMNGAKFTPATKIETIATSDNNCRELCVKDKTCFSFTFYPKSQKGKNICEIHTSLSSAVQQAGAYSGRIFRPIAPCDISDWNKCLK